MLKKFGFAAGITAIQIFLVVPFASYLPQSLYSLPDFVHENLCNGNCAVHALIAAKGFVQPSIPAFHEGPFMLTFTFPGYPMLTRGLGYLGGSIEYFIPAEILSQLGTLIFWYALFEVFIFLQFSFATAAVVTLFIFSYPTSFYFVSGFNESLFMGGFLIFILGFMKKQKAWPFTSSVAGYCMSTLKLAGLGLSAIPVMQYFLGRLSKKKQASLPKIACVSFLAAMGAVTYFIYCHFAFGHWDMYWISEKKMYNVNPNWLFFLDMKTYTFNNPTFNDVNTISRFEVPLTVLLFAVFACIEIFVFLKNANRDFYFRFPFYAAAGAIFFVSAAAAHSFDYPNMVRYNLPVHIFLSIAGADLWTRHFSKLKRKPWTINFFYLLFIIYGFGMLYVQRRLIQIFVQGNWVS